MRWRAAFGKISECGGASHSGYFLGLTISSDLLAFGRTLEDFFTAAMNNNPELLIARESIAIGTARKRAARGQLLPQLNANASLSSNRREEPTQPSRSFDGERYSLQMSQVLFDWQSFAARKRAGHIEAQLEAEYFGQLADLLTDVAEKYFDVLQAEDDLKSLRAELDAVSKQRDQIQSLYDRQLVQITDLYEAQASLAAVEAGLLKGKSELIIRTESLRAVSGLSVGRLYRLDPKIDVPPLDQGIDYYIREAALANHEIVAEGHALKAADKKVSEAKGMYLPSVTLIAQARQSDLGFENAPISETDSTYVGIDVTLPLFAGGRNQAAVSEARSQRNIAANRLRRAELDSTGRVRAAFLQVETSQLRTQAAQKLLESARLSATANQKGFELGVVTSVDVLNALRDSFQTERDLHRARYEHIKFLLALERESGLLGPDDLGTVNGWLIGSE